MIEMFLCSYFAGAATLFEDYARQNIRAKEVLFIPTAANVEEYRDYVDEAKEAFAKMGFEVQILDVSKASEGEAKAKIGAAQVLYVSGGNTFYLLQESRPKRRARIRGRVGGCDDRGAQHGVRERDGRCGRLRGRGANGA